MGIRTSYRFALRDAGGHVLASLAPGKFAATSRAYSLAGLVESDAHCDRLVRANAEFCASYYARLATLTSGHHRRRLHKTVQPSGVEGFLRAADGPGAIIVAPHLGDFDLAASWIAEVLGIVPSVPVARISPAARQAAFSAVRARCGFLLRVSGVHGVQQLARDLERGCVVVAMIDRSPGSNGLPVTFFRRPARVSSLPVVLAQVTGATLVSAATIAVGDRRRALMFGDPISRGEIDPKDPSRALQRLVADAERAIAFAPEQWHVPAQLSKTPWKLGTET